MRAGADAISRSDSNSGSAPSAATRTGSTMAISSWSLSATGPISRWRSPVSSFSGNAARAVRQAAREPATSPRRA